MGLRIGKWVVLLLMTSSMLTACAEYHARLGLSRGLLALNLDQDDFVEQWGDPNHTAAISGDEIIKSGIAGWGGFFFKGRDMYEMWGYDVKKTQLVFYEHQLVAWKTSQTVQELATHNTLYPINSSDPQAVSRWDPGRHVAAEPSKSTDQ